MAGSLAPILLMNYVMICMACGGIPASFAAMALKDGLAYPLRDNPVTKEELVGIKLGEKGPQNHFFTAAAKVSA